MDVYITQHWHLWILRNTGNTYYAISYGRLSRLRASPKYFGKVCASACSLVLLFTGHCDAPQFLLHFKMFFSVQM